MFLISIIYISTKLIVKFSLRVPQIPRLKTSINFEISKKIHAYNIIDNHLQNLLDVMDKWE